jgi:uncharacterized protein YcbK (DUF882 family)
MILPMSPLTFPVFGIPGGKAKAKYTVSVGAGGIGVPATVTVTIVAASGRLPSGSFTTAPNENVLDLQATATGLSPGAQLQWDVVDDPTDHRFSLAPPSTVAGLSTTVTVPRQDTLRWINPGNVHRRPLDWLELRYVVTAAATVGQTSVTSAPVTVRQTELDAMREEYVEYRIPFPNPAWTRQGLTTNTPFTFDILNGGDYSWAVIDSTLPKKLGELQDLAGHALGITSGYRDPMHYRLHVEPSGGQPHRPQSVHQYGIAADIDTGRSDRSWYTLRVFARRIGACVEPINLSTNSHLHVDTRTTTCPEAWRS